MKRKIYVDGLLAATSLTRHPPPSTKRKILANLKIVNFSLCN